MSRLTPAVLGKRAIPWTLTLILVVLVCASDRAAAAPEDFRSRWVGQSAYPVLPAGTIGSYTVQYRNVGSATWRRGVSGSQVTLGVAGDSRTFADQGIAAGWLWADRIVATTEDTVAPGAVGTFTFNVRAPSAGGTYVIPLRLVVDGLTWLDDEGVHVVLTSDAGFHTRWVSQSANPRLGPGETATVSIVLRNTGGRAFRRGAPGEQLNLGVAHDDVSWGHRGVVWLSANRPATTTEAVVAPGGLATFTFALRAPSEVGTHVLRLRPVVDGVAWLDDEGIHVVVSVLGVGVLVGAGDIATCQGQGDEATAALLDRTPGTVITLGDNAYDSGTPHEFATCYDPSWGRHRARTRAVAGNHEYATPNAAGHFGYFGAAAGEPGKGYYSFDVGSWHVVALNSNCGMIGGCGPGSPQERWLRADLAAHRTVCVVAYWHHARWSSGPHGPDAATDALWRALYEAGAEIVLSGHDHHYERFAPQDPLGIADPARGIRQFVVGTGGAPLRAVRAASANSEVARYDTHGVLELTLHAGRYEWRFLSVSGETVDRGSAGCH